MLAQIRLLTVLSGLFLLVGSAYSNVLKDHASPYLAMHGDDPTQWHEWNKQTVEKARRENKLLFVSSGYFSCHWCHVMQKESYQNPDIAALLNKHFIPVKVDRELEPALDAHLIEFVERTQGYSGWPLNVFVTPEGYPLVGLVYAPADNFKTILEKLSAEWQAKSDDLKGIALAATAQLATGQTTTSNKLPTDLARSLQAAFVNQVFSLSDTLQGGFGQENKFPSVPQLMVLTEIYKQKPEKRIKSFLELTFNQMASQGLRDQLGGGFYRYVVDPGWQIPHFEKMLYDNALLASLYFRAAQVLQHPAYQDVATETLDFMLSELDTGRGAFAASLSAVDDKGVEGGYYLWTKEELSPHLTGQELAVVSKFWQLDDAPDLEDGHHLVQAMSLPELAKELKLEESKVSALLTSAGDKMLELRNKRVLPKDAKILTGWNGLALSALVDGAQATSKSEYRVAANRLRDFIENMLWDSDNQVLHKAIGAKGSLGQGGLEDYAYVSQGLYRYWQMTGDIGTRKLLQTILGQAWKRFYGKQGWILAEDMLLKFGQGKTIVSDSPLPSPSSLITQTSFLFGKKTNNPALVNQALRAMNVGHTEVAQDAFWFGSQIQAITDAGN